jgi:CheY-like chemotaxis protein
VDDEPSLRDILSQILDGYHVTTVPNGYEAVRILEQTPFEMVITDLMMPQVDGFTVLVTAKKANPEVDVLVLTGYPSLENERRCRALRASKPASAVTRHARLSLRNPVESMEMKRPVHLS